MLFNNNFFFSHEECEEILLFCEKVGIKPIHKIDAYNKWDMLRIHNDEFKQKILKKYKEVFSNTSIFPFDLDKVTHNEIYLSLTRYYGGRFLEMHRDTSSDLTTVIPLTDEFDDGRFVLSEDKISIENKTFTESNLHIISKGYGLTFNGGTIWHGVMPVYTGIRKSLNIWIDPGSFKIQTGNGDFFVKTQKSFL
jgi:hypothetical protein